MPSGLVIEYAEIGRELEARERLSAIMDMRVGYGIAEGHARRRHLHELSRAARGPHYEPPPVSPEDAKAELAAIGIPIHKVRRGDDA